MELCAGQLYNGTRWSTCPAWHVLDAVEGQRTVSNLIQPYILAAGGNPLDLMCWPAECLWANLMELFLTIWGCRRREASSLDGHNALKKHSTEQGVKKQQCSNVVQGRTQFALQCILVARPQKVN